MFSETLAQLMIERQPEPPRVRPERLPWEDDTRLTRSELAHEWGVHYKTAGRYIQSKIESGELIPAGDKKYQTIIGHIRTAPSFRKVEK